jgi:hypothetical protein
MGNETEKDRNQQSNPAGTVDQSKKNPPQQQQGGQNPNQQDPSKKNPSQGNEGSDQGEKRRAS